VSCDCLMRLARSAEKAYFGGLDQLACDRITWYASNSPREDQPSEVADEASRASWIAAIATVFVGSSYR
jgi:hypothetical protein